MTRPPLPPHFRQKTAENLLALAAFIGLAALCARALLHL